MLYLKTFIFVITLCLMGAVILMPRSEHPEDGERWIPVDGHWEEG